MSPSTKKEAAGKQWLKGFLERHSEVLFVVQPLAISAAHVKSFTRENENKFFGLLASELKKINFQPEPTVQLR